MIIWYLQYQTVAKLDWQGQNPSTYDKLMYNATSAINLLLIRVQLSSVTNLEISPGGCGLTSFSVSLFSMIDHSWTEIV